MHAQAAAPLPLYSRRYLCPNPPRPRPASGALSPHTRVFPLPPPPYPPPLNPLNPLAPGPRSDPLPPPSRQLSARADAAMYHYPYHYD